MTKKIIETATVAAIGIWDPNKAREEDYETLRALDLFHALDADILDEEYVLARLHSNEDVWALLAPDGRIAYEAGDAVFLVCENDVYCSDRTIFPSVETFLTYCNDCFHEAPELREGKSFEGATVYYDEEDRVVLFEEAP